MSKSILVIDTPKSCADCPCCFADNVMVWCGKEQDILCEPGEMPEGIETFKPDWCPLRWNMCIDEILKGDRTE